jgi:hypothetical protein
MSASQRQQTGLAMEDKIHDSKLLVHEEQII